MKRYSVVITQPAVGDLSGIARYIAQELREPGIARQQIARIKEAVMSLEEYPGRYALVTDGELSAKGYRKVAVDHYIVFYIITEETNLVTVIRILYEKRDWIHLL
jgi:toxin ParE1/3/4